jgi:hypothetical protein
MRRIPQRPLRIDRNSTDKRQANIMIRTVVIAACLAALCGTQILFTPALAGGDDYDGPNDAAAMGPVYYGFVLDVRGYQVADAQVVLRPKSGDPVTTTTNALGLYRSHVDKDVAPDDVEISCEKPGYRQTKVYRRTPPGTKSLLIETECTLQRL